jgi:hypothetical protein
MEVESSLGRSQVPATCPYPEPDRSGPHSHKPLPEVTKMSFSQKTQQYIQLCKACYYMLRLQVTIIRQTFQYMDMTCSLLTVWDPILFIFAM